jgi:hypothetical protein
MLYGTATTTFAVMLNVSALVRELSGSVVKLDLALLVALVFIDDSMGSTVLNAMTH